MILIGDRVLKTSGKPFKSGRKINTVRGFEVNPHTNKPAINFVEDDSFVDFHQCQKVNDKTLCPFCRGTGQSGGLMATCKNCSGIGHASW